ncbi:BHLH domain-containing protein [Trichonephila inaurata madagascariensis]|uniref:BHLH domain-containing protein n=1 Tax=Trichonephila inaurata madagascariensis TaxID=2747483 RepID=A0A8X6WMZ2_9ARAC|nr:BHLH domain-containing protein [Trichonephila inaurata madagascariensis]
MEKKMQVEPVKIESLFSRRVLFRQNIWNSFITDLMGRRKIKNIPHHVRERLRHQNLQKILEDVANYVPSPMTVQKETKTKKLRRVVLYVKYLLLKEKELNKASAGNKQTSKKQGILMKRKTAFQKVPLKCKDPKAHIVFLTKSSEKNVPFEKLASSYDAENQPKADSFHAVSCSTVPTNAYMPNGGTEIELNGNFQLWTDQSVEHSDRITSKDKIGTVKDSCVVERQTSSLNQNEFLFKDSYFTDPKRSQYFSFAQNIENFATSLKENQSDYVPEELNLPCQFKKSTFSLCKKDVLNSLGTNDPQFLIDEENFKFQSNISPTISKEFSNYSGLQRKKPSTNQISFSQNSDNVSSEFFSSEESGPLTSSNEYILSDDDYSGFIEIPYQNQNLLSFVPETAHDEDNFENNFISIQRSHDINSSPDIFVPNTSVDSVYNNAHNKYGKGNNISTSERSNFSRCESAAVYKDLGPVDRLLNMHCNMNLYPPYLAQNFQGVWNQTVSSGNIAKSSNFTPRDENFMKHFYLPQQSNMNQPIQIKQEPLLPAEEPSYSFNNFDYSTNWFMDTFNPH